MVVEFTTKLKDMKEGNSSNNKVYYQLITEDENGKNYYFLTDENVFNDARLKVGNVYTFSGSYYFSYYAKKNFIKVFDFKEV